MFLPVSKIEMEQLGWKQLDVIIVTGDVYIDSPYDGAAAIGKYLTFNGFKTGIISQPGLNNKDIKALGEPLLFWGVTAGCVDSMVANYTALKKKRRSDSLTPGGQNNRRPDRAIIKYVNLIKQNFKNTVPVVIGGIEASLRRVAHYDYWQDKLRRSVLFDSKADILVYGMGERQSLEIAEVLNAGKDWRNIKGICYSGNEIPAGFTELPSFEECTENKEAFVKMFNTFYQNNDPVNAVGLAQKHAKRYLIQNPPSNYFEGNELDRLYDFDYKYTAHPELSKKGKIKAEDTVKFSIISHRGCFGECNFCAIAVHQGRKIRSRSIDSILKEAENFRAIPGFKGNIYDIGGASANMYGMECAQQNKKGSCTAKRCAFPEMCKSMNIDHSKQRVLLSKLRRIKGIKKIFVGSGIRYDIVLADKKNGEKYLKDIITHHVSGQMKIAPEHISAPVLENMGKPGNDNLIEFKNKFAAITKKAGKKQFLTYYILTAHPGCETKHTSELQRFLSQELKTKPEQIQIFTPTPSTYSTLMYYTGINPFTREEIKTAHGLKEKSKQKEALFKCW